MSSRTFAFLVHPRTRPGEDLAHLGFTPASPTSFGRPVHGAPVMPAGAVA